MDLSNGAFIERFNNSSFSLVSRMSPNSEVYDLLQQIYDRLTQMQAENQELRAIRKLERETAELQQRETAELQQNQTTESNHKQMENPDLRIKQKESDDSSVWVTKKKKADDSEAGQYHHASRGKFVAHVVCDSMMTISRKISCKSQTSEILVARDRVKEGYHKARKNQGVRKIPVKRRYHRARRKKSTNYTPRPDLVRALQCYGMFGSSVYRGRLENRKAERMYLMGKRSMVIKRIHRVRKRSMGWTKIAKARDQNTSPFPSVAETSNLFSDYNTVVDSFPSTFAQRLHRHDDVTVLCPLTGSIVHAEEDAKRSEELAYATANKHFQNKPEDDGTSVVQVYAKESSKLMLEVIKRGPQEESDVKVKKTGNILFDLSGGRRAFIDEEEAHELLRPLTKPHSSYIKICFSNRSFGSEAAKFVVSILSSIKDQLTEVDLSYFVAGRPEAEALEVMNMFSSALEGCKLRYLNLSDNALGEKGIRAFVALIKSQNDLEELYLMNDGNFVDAARAVRELRPSTGKIRVLHFHNNMTGDEGTIAIAEIVRQCPSLEEFRCSSTRIGSEGGVALAEAIEFCSHLKKLDLHENMFGAEGGIALAMTLLALTDLTEIYMSYLNLEEEGTETLSEAFIKSVPSLEVLEMAGNDITVKSTGKLAACIVSKQFLSKLILSKRDNTKGNEEGKKLWVSYVRSLLGNWKSLELKFNSVKNMCGWVYDKGKMKLRNNDDGNNKEKTDQWQNLGMKWVLVLEKLCMLRIEVKRAEAGLEIMIFFYITWDLNGELNQVHTGIEDKFMNFYGLTVENTQKKKLLDIKDGMKKIMWKWKSREALGDDCDIEEWRTRSKGYVRGNLATAYLSPITCFSLEKVKIRPYLTMEDCEIQMTAVLKSERFLPPKPPDLSCFEPLEQEDLQAVCHLHNTYIPKGSPFNRKEPARLLRYGDTPTLEAHEEVWLNDRNGEYFVGEWVYLKLRLYREGSVAKRKNKKLQSTCLPTMEPTWESLSDLVNQFRAFNFEDKVSLLRGSIDRLRALVALMRRKMRSNERKTKATEKSRIKKQHKSG